MKSKSTFTVILFYSMAAMLMIAIHQNIINGFAASYVFYMITFMLFLGFTYRKMGETKEAEGHKKPKTAKHLQKTKKSK